MGFGLGASIGAKLGCPDKLVFNIAGDGCFRMNMNEIATAARCRSSGDTGCFERSCTGNGPPMADVVLRTALFKYNT